jgi:hypothetical protein
VTKAGREIMEIFEAFDLTGTAWSAAQLAGSDAKRDSPAAGVGGNHPRTGDATLPRRDQDRIQASRR